MPPQPDPGSDEALWARFRQGDKSAFSKVFERRQPALLRFLGRIFQTLPYEELENIAHDAWIKLIGEDFDPARECKFSTWLTTKATEFALNERKRKRNTTSVPLTEDRSDPAEEQTPESTLEGKLRIKAVDEALDALPQVQRQAVILLIQGLSLKQIAEELCVPIGTIKSRLSRATKTLKKRVK